MSNYTSWLSSDRWPAAFLAAAAGCILLVFVAFPMMDEAPKYDEIFHILAARGLLSSGSPTIADGEYRRALLFTHQVAAAFSLLGESPRVARLPALLAAVGLVALMGAWVTRRCGVLAGITTSVFIATSSILVDMAVFIRFYSMQILCVAVCGVSVFAATEQSCTPQRRLVWMLIGAAAALAALSVAPSISLMALVAIGAATLFVWIDANRVKVSTFLGNHRKAALLVAVALPLLIIGGFTRWIPGLWNFTHTTSLWAAPRAGVASYYVTKFASESSLLWPVWPAAALISFYTNRRLAIFCTTLVLVGLLLHSLAAQKAIRYAAYLWPWACVLLGYAAAQVVVWGGRKLQSSALRSGGTFFAVLLLGFAFVLSDQGRRSVSLILDSPAEVRHLENSEPSWEQAAPIAKSLLADSDVLMVSSSMKALYYLGDYDYEISATVLPETESGEEFGRDERTGRRVISSPESFKSIIARSRNVVLVLEDGKIGTPSGVIPETVEAIRASCKLVEHVEPSSVTIWSCKNSA